MSNIFGFRGVAIAGLMLGLLCGPAAAAVIVADAQLTGNQENPPVTTAALGGAVLAVDTINDTYDVAIFVSGITPDRLTASPAHIHIGAVGFNGPVTHDFLAHGGTIEPFGTTGFKLLVEGGPFNGASVRDHASTGSATLLQHLLNGNLYINIHTTQHPGGEIRGQLTVIPEPASLGVLGLAGLGMLRRRRSA